MKTNWGNPATLWGNFLGFSWENEKCVELPEMARSLTRKCFTPPDMCGKKNSAVVYVGQTGVKCVRRYGSEDIGSSGNISIL